MTLIGPSSRLAADDGAGQSIDIRGRCEGTRWQVTYGAWTVGAELGASFPGVSGPRDTIGATLSLACSRLPAVDAAMTSKQVRFIAEYLVEPQASKKKKAAPSKRKRP